MMASVAIVIDSATASGAINCELIYAAESCEKETDFCNVDRDIATFPHMPRISDMFVVSVEDTGNMIIVVVFLTWGV